MDRWVSDSSISKQKAHQTSASAGTGKSVNSRLRDALSPSRSPSPPGHGYGRSSSPRSWSRSPPRHGPHRVTHSMLHKRRWDDDRHATPQYERRGPTRSENGPFHRSKLHGERDDGNRDRAPKRRRSRSPIASTLPQRASVHSKSSSECVLGRGVKNAERIGGAKPVSEDAETAPNARSSLRNTEVHFDPSQPSPKSSDHSPVEPSEGQAKNETTAMTIEERRRRREAIRARHRAAATPLLAQALQKSSVLDSPQPVALSSSASPRTPIDESRPASPETVHVANDSDLANIRSPARTETSAPGTPGGPSAADYDPSADKDDDRLRHSSHQAEAFATADDETCSEKQDHGALIPEPKRPTEKTAASDDMFASDEDDGEDMFAEVPSKSRAQSAKAAPAQQAKALNIDLMDNWDDHEGYYRIIMGELLENRYHVQASLGKGMFSGVVRAIDAQTQQLVAIKIIRNNESMAKAAAKEMGIIEKLAEADPDDKKHLIRLQRHFVHKGHLCLVFENLSLNLRDVLKKFGRDVGINLKAIRSYAQQMFLGLSLLRRCNILHADLKPDNILVNESRTTLKICDLGSAADASESDITPYLVSRFYRAPEVILGAPYDFAIDMWSIGCTLYELYTGKILFTGRNNNQMLRSIMETRGRFTLKTLKKGELSGLYFDEQGSAFRSVERDRVTGRDVTKLITFARPSKDLKSRLVASAPKGLSDAEAKELSIFADLLDKCLALNPEKRITPNDALRHPFIHREAATRAGFQKA